MKIKFLINEIQSLNNILNKLDSPKTIKKFINFVKDNDVLQYFLTRISTVHKIMLNKETFAVEDGLYPQKNPDIPRIPRVYDLIDNFFTEDEPATEFVIQSLSFILKILIKHNLDNYDLNEEQKALVANWIITKFFSPGHILKERTAEMNFRYFVNFPRTHEKYFQYQRFVPEKYRNLMNVESYERLVDLIDNAEAYYEQWITVNKSAKLKRESEYRKIFGDDNFNIYIPDNQQAACLLGMGTRWCTAALTSDNYYNDYHKEDDPLFVLISKKDPTEKYQFHFGSKQFMNKDDDEIDISKFNEFMAEYHKVFSEYCYIGSLADKYHDDFSLNLRTEKEIKFPEFEIVENEYGKERKYIWVYYDLEYDDDFPPSFVAISHWYVPEWIYVNMGYNYLNGTKESRRELENLISRNERL